MTKVTPEQARKLLEDAATPGPWERRQCGERHGYGGAPLCGAEIVGPIHAEYIDAATADLAAAAPDLAETVAGLKVEYAVQVLIDDHAPFSPAEWVYARSYRSTSEYPDDAWWTSEPNEQLAESWGEYPTRAVRRLMSDPEVVS